MHYNCSLVTKQACALIFQVTINYWFIYRRVWCVSDRKQEFRTQYLEQGATPCAVSDALHCLATTCSLLRNFLAYEETYSR